MPDEAPERRRRGRRPADAAERRAAVESALADLNAARVPFSMGDLAERAGISRATLYRDAGLRDLVGAAGNGPAHRPVDARSHRDLQNRTKTVTTERDALRRQVRALEKRATDAESLADRLEKEILRLTRQQAIDDMLGSGAAEKIRDEAYAAGFTAGTRAAAQRGGGGGGAGRGGSGANAGLLSVAQRLPRASVINARKTLARALHPDLYANDPAAALLATELLQQINALVTPPQGR